MPYPPALPRIEDPQLYSSVFTHPLLNRMPMAGEYGDIDRLADLGRKVLELAVTHHFFLQREPTMLPAQEIHQKRLEYFTEECFSGWLDIYNMKNQLICLPDHLWDGNTGECGRLFTTFVGAVFFCSGMEVVQNWISQLISPGSAPPPPPPPPQQAGPFVQSSSSNLPPYAQPPLSAPPPPQPTSPPPPIPPIPPMNHDPTSLVSLALVHQTASKNGVLVQYQAFQQGPAHQPTWTVHCLMNNEVRGQGVGKNQKTAKEEAARHAYVAMGWMPRYF